LSGFIIYNIFRNIVKFVKSRRVLEELHVARRGDVENPCHLPLGRLDEQGIFCVGI
jgi:hypothetical protein